MNITDEKGATERLHSYLLIGLSDAFDCGLPAAGTGGEVRPLKP